MKAGDFFFRNGNYYVIKQVSDLEEKVYYIAYYFYAMYPSGTLHIDNVWRTFIEFNERFSKIEWNIFNKSDAKKMIIRTFKE